MQWKIPLRIVFVVGMFPACLYSQLDLTDHLSIVGSCTATCFVGTVVNYICTQSSSDSFGSATCVAQDTWTQTCLPAGE